MFFQSEKGLIKKAQQGDKRAWLTLVKQYEKPIYHSCLRMVSNPDDALEIMQESFMSIYRSLDKYRFESSFKTWAIAITNRRCVEFYRARKVLDEEQQEMLIAESKTPEPADFMVFMAEQNKQVLKLLNDLPWVQKEVVELKFFQHFTFDQIAEQLGVSTNTVKSRLYSALSKLRQDLEVLNG
ncbi:RNA polymerase sigma factor [Pseudoalteromonas sp. SSM20]|uniref:RNA polymerase sigma factor n=1 Tax=Pseudoalteromonas sp. SSM20 TaxID=3139394 RepID=UPI003BABDC4E